MDSGGVTAGTTPASLPPGLSRAEIDSDGRHFIQKEGTRKGGGLVGGRSGRRFPEEGAYQVDWERENDRRILLGPEMAILRGDGRDLRDVVQCLEVAQLEGRRRLADDLRGFFQGE